MVQVYSQSGLSLTAPRSSSFATNDFCHSLCIGSGDDIWVATTGWDGSPNPVGGESKIERFNRKTGDLIASISVGPYESSGTYPHICLGIAALSSITVCADYADGAAVIVDQSNNTITKRTSVGAGPRDAVADSNGFWISVSGEEKIVKLDSDGDLISSASVSFSSGSIPYRMSMGDDGYLYVSDFGLNRVWKVDTSAHTSTTYYSVGSNPWDCSVRNGLLLTSNVGSTNATIIDMTTSSASTISLSSGDGPHDCMILEDSSSSPVFLIVCSGANSIKMLSSSGSLLHTISVQTDPASMAYDGEYLYNVNALSNTVTVNRIEGAQGS